MSNDDEPRWIADGVAEPGELRALLDKLQAMVRHSHWVDISVRRNGRTERFEGDFLKRILGLLSSAAPPHPESAVGSAVTTSAEAAGENNTPAPSAEGRWDP